MKQPELETATKEDLMIYIKYLEGCLNGAGDLLIEMNLTSQVLAHDLEKIRNGENGIIYIGKKDSKGFEHILAIFKEFDRIKALSQHFLGTEKQSTQKKLSLPAGANAFEHVITEAKKNGSTKH